MAEYKGILSQLGRVKKSDEIIEKLREYHKRLITRRKSGMVPVFVFVLFFFCATAYQVNAKDSPKSRLLHTPHYGILTDYELKNGPNRNSFWQCFPTKSVSVEYDSWKDADPMGPADKIVTMCLYGINAKHGKVLSEFIGRRANRIDVCTNLVANWKKLTKGERFVCINGEGLDFELESMKKGPHSWTWVKFKTTKGCYAYFPDDCN